MAEGRSYYGGPKLLPIVNGRDAKWLESISRGRVASAREFGRTLRGRSPYVVVYSENQKRYVVFFNDSKMSAIFITIYFFFFLNN